MRISQEKIALKKGGRDDFPRQVYLFNLSVVDLPLLNDIEAAKGGTTTGFRSPSERQLWLHTLPSRIDLHQGSIYLQSSTPLLLYLVGVIPMAHRQRRTLVACSTLQMTQ